MARITISGLEDKKPVTGTGTTGGTSAGTSSGNSGGTTAGNTNTGAGTTISPGKASGNKTGGSTSFSDILAGIFGNKTNAETPTQEPAISPETRAETSIGDLRNKYAQKLQNQYDYSAQKLKNERDAALRENWILQQQAEAALPEQMAAAGINGGASETSLAALRARYQGDRNNIRGNYMDNLGDLSQQAQSERAEAERSYNERWLDYLLNLSRMEQQHKYDKELM